MTRIALLNAAAGVYGAPAAPRLRAHSRWALVDPASGEVLRAFEEDIRL